MYTILYGAAFVLYLAGVWIPTLNGIALLFGLGMALDSMVSLCANLHLRRKKGRCLTDTTCGKQPQSQTGFFRFGAAAVQMKASPITVICFSMTLSYVAEKAKIDRAEAEELIQAALRNMQCADIYRSFGAFDGEAEESREEITISPYPEPYEALLKEYQAKALCLAWESLDYREQEMLAAHLGFCPDCFSVLERTGSSDKWYDCALRKRTPYADLAIDFGLSSPESVQRICEHAIKKLQISCEIHFTSLFGLMD